MNTDIEKKYCLQPLPPDDDFSHSRVFGILGLSELPTQDFFVSEPREIKNQDINYPSDFCAAYAACEVSEDQEAVNLVPEYTFAKAKQLLAVKQSDNILEQYGLNLRDVCMAALQGFLERDYDPFGCDTENRPERTFIADWRNWPADLDQLAADHRKNSFFTIDGPYDRFDNYRMAMWQNRAESRSILTGVYWRQSWTQAPQGVIPPTYEETPRLPHALKIFGQVTIDGVMYLAAQLSDGATIGDCGVFYFSREIVNKEFGFGEFTFKDMPKAKAKYYHENNVSVEDSFIVRTCKVLWNILLTLIGKK